MKRSERDAWVAALRSGKYKQGRGRLHAGDTFCCLGVRCDMDGEEWKPSVDCEDGRPDKNENGLQIMEDGEGFVALPSNRKLNKWGLKYPLASEVAEMNDAGKSFAEIADWIEANVPVEED